MSTLVDELLQDFEDSGSEQGDERKEHDILGDGDGEADATNGDDANGDMDLDGGAVQDDDEEMGGVTGSGKNAAEDPEEAKQRIEKLQLKGVGDVRSVAGLMRTLEPVLEVSSILLPPLGHLLYLKTLKCLHPSFWTIALTVTVRPCRKSHISKHNRPRRAIP